MSSEAIQIAQERREVKGKAEGEKYTQLNTVFQRIARRDKKAFLNEQCKEIENEQCKEIEEQCKEMGKTRDFFKKTGDIKGKFHMRIGTIKDRNDKDLTEAEEIFRRR